MNRTAIAGLALAALSLAACDDGRVKGNHALCYTFHTTSTTTTATTAPAAPATDLTALAATPIDECLRRWAYSLAPSRDPADTVSDAVVAACTGDLARWNEQGLGQGGNSAEAPSITTGQPTNAMAEHNALAHGRALLYVVEARAGNCAPPPVTNGAPQG